MALLRDPERELPLPARCLIGRSRVCDLVIAGRDVSSQHAVLQWASSRWELQDLGSRNGTYVDDVRIASGARVPLVEGATVSFGRESPPWRLIDAAAPGLIAQRLDDAIWRAAEGSYLALPDAEDPTLVIYQDNGERWVLERDGAIEVIDDRAQVDAGGLWRVYLPSASIGTWESDDKDAFVAELRLEFTVSRDEESVGLVAWSGERRTDLLVRTHHYVLLLLARQRLADRKAGVDPAEEGWIRQDDLVAMLRIPDNHLYIAIHRARAQLGKAKIADAQALIERRTGTRLLRLGVADLEITTGR